MVRSHRFLGALLATFLASACSGAPQPSSAELSLEALHGPDLASVQPVDRLVLRGFPLERLADLWLVAGEVSSASEGRLARGEVPEVVAEERVPLAAFVGSEGEIVLAPTVILESGASYTLVAVGSGLIATFEVDAVKPEVLFHWGEEAVEAGQAVAYCRGAPPSWSEVGRAGEALLEEAPSATEPLSDVMISGGLDDSGYGAAHCVRVFVPENTADFFVPPAKVGKWSLDPAVLSVEEFRQETDADDHLCDDAQAIPFAAGCARVLGPALELELPPGVYYIDLFEEGSRGEGGIVALVATKDPSARALGPLAPDTDYELRVTHLDGNFESSTVSLRTGAPSPHFVLNEVLADPLGGEPEAEWVEVVNVGSGGGSLGGMFLWDAGGGVDLPDVELAPGEFGLIVRPDFDFASDVLPDAASLPIIVPSLGENGLRNSGEEVSLRDAQGAILSRMPARATKEGTSLARTEPWAPDVEESFVFHPTPGSSPGAANVSSDTEAFD